ncbi:MAG: hypothetical protein K0S04_1433 [Herbinix sp.]|jgi:uncharacterized membrane protein|nr:hypothetical protein [Herbinix sp.]
MKQKYIFAVAEIIVLGIVILLAITVLQDEYLFGWAAHNWIFYSVLGAIVLLLTFLNKIIVSFCMTAGITLGIFIGSFLGNVIKISNESKIIEGMTGEEIYRLRHHPGFEIWMGIILLSIVVGFIVQLIVTKKRRSDV